MQRTAFALRHVRKKPWEEIAKEARNLQGEQTPSGGLETTLKRAAIGKARSAKIPMEKISTYILHQSESDQCRFKYISLSPRHRAGDTTRAGTLHRDESSCKRR